MMPLPLNQSSLVNWDEKEQIRKQMGTKVSNLESEKEKLLDTLKEILEKYNTLKDELTALIENKKKLNSRRTDLGKSINDAALAIKKIRETIAVHSMNVMLGLEDPSFGNNDHENQIDTYTAIIQTANEETDEIGRRVDEISIQVSKIEEKMRKYSSDKSLFESSLRQIRNEIAYTNRRYQEEETKSDITDVCDLGGGYIFIEVQYRHYHVKERVVYTNVRHYTRTPSGMWYALKEPTSLKVEDGSVKPEKAQQLEALLNGRNKT